MELFESFYFTFSGIFKLISCVRVTNVWFFHLFQVRKRDRLSAAWEFREERGGFNTRATQKRGRGFSFASSPPLCIHTYTIMRQAGCHQSPRTILNFESFIVFSHLVIQSLNQKLGVCYAICYSNIQ